MGGSRVGGAGRRVRGRGCCLIALGCRLGGKVAVLTGPPRSWPLPLMAPICCRPCPPMLLLLLLLLRSHAWVAHAC